MYKRIKQLIFLNNNSDNNENFEEIKVEQYTGNTNSYDDNYDNTDNEDDNINSEDDDNTNSEDNNTNSEDNNTNNYNNKKKYKKINLKSKISNIFKFVVRGLKTSIFTGLSHSWFLTCCISIFTHHYIIYKLSNKTPEDYNKMVKNITTKISTKNIFFTKIFQAFANNNNLVDKDLFNYFITYTDNVKYDINEIDYDGLYDLINIANKHGDELILDSDIPIKSGNIALIFNGTLNSKNIIIKYCRNNIKQRFNKSMNE